MVHNICIKSLILICWENLLTNILVKFLGVLFGLIKNICL